MFLMLSPEHAKLVELNYKILKRDNFQKNNNKKKEMRERGRDNVLISIWKQNHY